MNGNQPARRPKKDAPASGGKGGGGGGRKGGDGGGRKGGGGGGRKRAKKEGKKKAVGPTIDPGRPLWENPAGEAELRAIVGSVRPAQNPTALVRSLGDPPLGRFAGNAQHYYEAVYEKAQRFAVAMAAANGLHVIDDTEDDETGGASGQDVGTGT